MKEWTNLAQLLPLFSASGEWRDCHNCHSCSLSSGSPFIIEWTTWTVLPDRYGWASTANSLITQLQGKMIKRTRCVLFLRIFTSLIATVCSRSRSSSTLLSLEIVFVISSNFSIMLCQPFNEHRGYSQAWKNLFPCKGTVMLTSY